MLTIIYLILCARGDSGVKAFFKVLLGLIFIVVDVVLILLVLGIIWLFS